MKDFLGLFPFLSATGFLVVGEIIILSWLFSCNLMIRFWRHSKGELGGVSFGFCGGGGGFGDVIIRTPI